MFGQTLGQTSQCLSDQVLLRDKCVDCKSLSHGCLECSRIKTKRYFSLYNTNVIECDVCDFGMFKLTLDDNQGLSTEGNVQYMASMCVRRCEDFGHNYVSNPNTMQCEYCGKDCQRCTLQYGCVECSATNNGKGLLNSTAYLDLLKTSSKGVTSSQFPYNFFDTTKNGGPSSDFQVCQSCDRRCSDCTGYVSEEEAAAIALATEGLGVNDTLPQSYGQCNSCHNYVQSSSVQKKNGGFCKLQKGDIRYCEQVDPSDPEKCQFCQKDYYVDSNDKCTICSSTYRESQGCKRCEKSKCLECLDGYALGSNGRCTKCSMSTENKKFYNFVNQRCENCESTTQISTCKHCDIGWQSSNTNIESQLLKPDFEGKVGDICSFKCAQGEYPFVDQSLVSSQFYETKAQGKKCNKCYRTCLNCAGSTKNHCTECPVGYYLKISDAKSQIGSCEKKLTTKDKSFDVYVSNLIDEQTEEGRQRTGTYEDPFAQLTDALVRAKDLAAPYKQRVTVKIHMFPGNHYSIENRYDALNIYLPKEASDSWQLNLDITIKPLECSDGIDSAHCGQDKVTIYNKIRERFVLDIFSKLTLEKIVIDSADSILPFGTPCLSERRACCKIDGKNMVNADLRKDEQCSKHFETIKLTDSCMFEETRTMFRAKDNKDRKQYEFSTNALVLKQSELRNIFYPMNSLVNITQHGGNITFLETKFQNINICGSIIKNTQGKYHNPDFSNITTKYMATKEKDYIETFKSFQYSLDKQYQNVYETSSADSVLFPSEIRIENSFFTNLNFKSTEIDSLPQVTEDGGMRYQGLVLNLERFNGQITIQGSRFENNIFKFKSCMLDDPFTLEEPDVKDNFDVLQRSMELDENYNTPTKFNKLQIKSLIDIRDHSQQLGLFNNTFRKNTGLKSIINLEQAYNKNSPNSFLIYGNVFEENSGLIDANVLSFRKLLSQSDLHKTTFRSKTDMKCGGLELQGNSFSKNVGCKNTQGVMYIYCMDSDHTETKMLEQLNLTRLEYEKNVSSRDWNETEYTGLNYTEEWLREIALQKVKYVNETDSQYLVGDHYDEELITQSPEEIKTTYTTHLVDGKTVKVDDLQIVLRQNEYTQNFAGNLSSIVHIEGFPMFQSIDEVYSQNENWHPEAFKNSTLSEYIKIESRKDLYSDLSNYLYKSMSILTVRKPLIVQISGTIFNENFVVDDYDPSKVKPLIQSQALLIKDFAGKITLNSGITFSNNTGASQGFEDQINMAQYKPGFKQKLIAFDKHKFKSFIVDDIKFLDNLAHNYQSEFNQPPRLLNLTDSDFGPQYELEVKTLEASGNTFIDSQAMVEFHKWNYTFQDYTLNRNGGESCKSVIKFPIDPYSEIAFENLTAEGNNIELGPLIDMSLEKDVEPSKNSCFDNPNLLVSNSRVENNTSKSKTTLFYLESLPWLWVRFQKTQLFNNYGTLTNEFHFENIRRLDIHDSSWNQYPTNPESDFEPGQVNSAKFLLMDSSDYYLDVQSSDFNCQSEFSKEMIFTMNQQREQGDSSLFKMNQASNPNSKFCEKDPSDRLKFKFDNTQFLNCNQALRGAIFQISDGVQVEISNSNSSMTNNSAIEGGFAFLEGHSTKIFIRDKITLSQQNAYFGGAFFLLDEAEIELQWLTFKNSNVYEGLIYQDRNTFSSLKNLHFVNNTVEDRAILSTHDYSFFELYDSVFQNNEIIGDSGIIYQDNTRNNKYYTGYENGLNKFGKRDDQISIVKRVIINKTEMYYGGNAIKIINSNMVFDELKLEENSIFSKSGGIHISYSNVNISNSVFNVKNTSDMFYFDAEEQHVALDHMGGYILIGPNSTLNSNNNQYLEARSNIGGCIAIIGYANVAFHNDKFIKCSALTGGAIAAHDFGHLSVNNCKFEQNIAFSGKGENIHASRFQLVTLNGTEFKSYMNSIYFDQGIDLQATYLDLFYEENIISTGRLDNRRLSGGFYILNMKQISKFSNISIQGLTAENGGCITVRLDQNFRPQLYNDKFYMFKDIKLQDCVATQNGGAIQLENIRKLEISNGTIEGSSALFKGGAINFNCEDQTLDCLLVLNEGLIITNNRALEGGGVFSRDILPDIDGAKIKNNEAALYGNDIASFPVQLVRFEPVSQTMNKDDIEEGKSDVDYFLRYFSTIVPDDWQELDEEDTPRAKPPVLAEEANWSVRLKIPGIQSGGMIPQQYLALLDSYNQVVTSNRGSQISITLSDETTQIIGVQTFFSMYGVYNISGMQILTEPGSSDVVMTLTAEQRAIKTKGAEFKLEFDLQIRECLAGEAQLQNGENFVCEKCIEGFYLLEKPPPKTAIECKFCPQGKALCKGGNEIGPDINYWRKSDMADVFLPCMRTDVCLGLYLYPEAKNQIERGYKPTGNCKEGYYGALCAACMPGYAAISQYTCSKCGDKTSNILKMVGVMILAIFCVTMLVKSTIAGQNQRQTHSVFIKILMNHMQMILITSGFDMKWPPQVKEFLQSITPLMEFQKAIVSYDCFMDPRDPASIGELEFEAGENEFRITYYKLLIYAAMPIFLGMCSITTWYCILKFKAGREETQKKADDVMKGLYDKFISTLVILLFLMHPTITNYMIDMFNCMNFDGESRLLTDPQIICGQNLHASIAIPLGGVCIVFWGIGIPALIYILMAKEKDNLETDAVKTKFGFLYNGYKRDNYYWEIIIMYRKIFCLFISVFLNGVGIVVQALVLLILLVVFTQLNNVTRPFGTRALNEVEDMSLYTQILTIYCGLFFISSTDPTSSTFNESKDFVIDDRTQYILFFTIVSSNVFFMVLWFVKFIMTLRVMIKQTSETLYIALFLCCRKDKLIKEDSKLAREAKRETIIEKIEEIQFFIKKMRDIYSKEIFYEGHDKFLKLLYHIENERKHVDLTVKRHNLYIQGAIARERKLDPTRIQEVLKNSDLMIDADQGGNNLQMEQIKKIQPDQKKVGVYHEMEMTKQSPDRRGGININKGMIGPTSDDKKARNKHLNLDDEIIFHTDNDERRITSPGSNNKISNENSRESDLGKSISKSRKQPLRQFPSMMSDVVSAKNDDGHSSKQRLLGLGSEEALTIAKHVHEAEIRIAKAKEGTGFESEEEKDADNTKKKKYKKPNIIDVQKDVNKSRNAKSRINYQQKERIFAEDLQNPYNVKTYMKKLFDEFVEPVKPDSESDYREESPSPEKSSPGKDSNAGKVKQFKFKDSENGTHLSSPPPSIGKASSIGGGSSKYKRKDLITEKNFDDVRIEELVEPATPLPGMDLQEIEQSRPMTPSKKGKKLSTSGISRSGSSRSRGGGVKTNVDLAELQLSGSITSPKKEENQEDESNDSLDMEFERRKIRDTEDYRKRLRPNVNLDYVARIEMVEKVKNTNESKRNEEDEGKLVPMIKVIETIKPNFAKKKSQKKVQFDPESGEEKDLSPSDSEKLELSILDSKEDLNFNYNREKQTEGAFVGSYSDRQSSHKEKKSKTVGKKKKEEFVPSSDTDHHNPSLGIGKMYQESSHQTFVTSPQLYPDKSKDTLGHGKSEQTLGANLHHSFNDRLKGDTAQTIAGADAPGGLERDKEVFVVNSLSDEDQFARMLPKTKVKRRNKKAEEPKLFSQIANLQNKENDESSQD